MIVLPQSFDFGVERANIFDVETGCSDGKFNM